MPADPRRVAVLVSGRGSNLKALIDRASGYEIALVASNKPQAQALETARAAGLPTWVHEGRGIPREDYDAMLTRSLEDHRVGTIALAGYCKSVARLSTGAAGSSTSTLRCFLIRGLNTHARPAAGDNETGCTAI